MSAFGFVGFILFQLFKKSSSCVVFFSNGPFFKPRNSDSNVEGVIGKMNALSDILSAAPVLPAPLALLCCQLSFAYAYPDLKFCTADLAKRSRALSLSLSNCFEYRVYTVHFLFVCISYFSTPPRKFWAQIGQLPRKIPNWFRACRSCVNRYELMSFSITPSKLLVCHPRSGCSAIVWAPFAITTFTPGCLRMWEDTKEPFKEPFGV